MASIYETNHLMWRGMSIQQCDVECGPEIRLYTFNKDMHDIQLSRLAHNILLKVMGSS